MNSQYAIKALEAYIKNLKENTPLYSRIEKGMLRGHDERIQSALEQIEMYKVGKGRLSI